MRTLIIITFLGIQLHSAAQDSSTNFLKVTYLGGQITHPGIKMAYGKTSLRSKKIKVKKSGKEKHKSRHWIGSINAAAQVHFKYRTAVLVYPALDYRVQNDDSGWFRQLGLGLGYQRSFQKDVYRVENDRAEKVWLGGDHQGCMLISTSIGRDLSISREQRVAWSFGPVLSLFGPGFGGLTSYLFIEAGVSVKLK